MKTSKFLQIGFIISVYITLSFFTSCNDDSKSEAEVELTTTTFVIASEVVESDELDSYWVKREGSNSWEMMTSQIDNFDYERGYEYVIEVSVHKIQYPGPDQLSPRYRLERVISKEKKVSEVPLFTKSLSGFDFKSQGELAFPNATNIEPIIILYYLPEQLHMT